MTERTPQRMAALARANLARKQQTALRHAVASGDIAIADALTDPRIARTTTVSDLLSWQRQWGRERARRLLRRAAVPEGKAVRGLTDRQRAAIVGALDHDAETLTGVGSRL